MHSSQYLKMSQGSKKFLLSKLAYQIDLAEDVVYTNHEGFLMVHSPSLGYLYDRPLPTEYYEQTIFPNISSTLKDGLVNHHGNHDTHDGNNRTASVFDKQAKVFLQILDDLQNEADSVAVMMLPAFSALVACLKAGWKPKNIAKVNFAL